MKKIFNYAILGALSNLLISTSVQAEAQCDNFYTSDKVTVEKVSFKNILGMNIAANLVVPNNKCSTQNKCPAIVIGHPFAAVKEQAATLYATKLAEKGIITLAFDQPFWGESDGYPRGSVIPDLYVESFSAGVDYLSANSLVNKDKIGALGICASGAFAVAATKIDTRIKALATVSMYDMGEYFRTGINNNRNKENVINDLNLANQNRDKSYLSGEPIYGPGQNDKVFVEAKESNAFYQTARGKVNTNDRRSTPASYIKFLNFFPFEGIEYISPRKVLFVVGKDAPTYQYTKTAYDKALAPKELYEVEGANRVDLYDRVDLIPFDKISSFFYENL